MYQYCFKRWMDVLLSSVALLLLLPLFILIALAIKLDDGGPVLFRQKRMGRHRTSFYILKFRTMRMDTPHDMPTQLLPNPERHITRVGRFLRKTSLDELPQLLQIWTGKMSIIGPRPVLGNEEQLLALRDALGANDVRPGLSGWAQINGRDEVSVEEKARLDGEYVRNISFAFDMKCIFATVFKVLRCENVVEGQQSQHV